MAYRLYHVISCYILKPVLDFSEGSEATKSTSFCPFSTTVMASKSSRRLCSIPLCALIEAYLVLVVTKWKNLWLKSREKCQILSGPEKNVRYCQVQRKMSDSLCQIVFVRSWYSLEQGFLKHLKPGLAVPVRLSCVRSCTCFWSKYLAGDKCDKSGA